MILGLDYSGGAMPCNGSSKRETPFRHLRSLSADIRRTLAVQLISKQR